MKKMNRQIEILAPAGSYEGMKAAINAGCDAVYIGGSSFGARAYANNLGEETLLHAIDEAHIRDKKIYLTVNTLLKEKERTSELYHFLEKFYLQGLDAVIVQDVGVLHFIHENFPELPIHASTQTTLTMAQGANLLKDYGVTRLVTARELSLREIKTIRENTDLEIETFVHGALCYCYSGQCLMSSIIGGRSGNRGRCAQPCRMPYQFHSGDKRLSSEQEKYLLSPKDINTISFIPDLVEAGIDSFKIEGRMKRPEYAAAVSSMYRKYVDLFFELGKEKYNLHLKSDTFEKDMILLQDVYSRGGFSEGYGKTYNSKKMMSLYRPNHSGVYVGDVTEIKGSQVSIALKEMINAQDILDIRHKEEEGYEFTVKDPHNIGDILRTNVGRRQETGAQDQKARGNRPQRYPDPIVRAGDPVYRTKNNALLESIAETYMEKEQRLGIKGLLTARIGEKLKLTLSYGECAVTAYQEVVQEALKQPMTKEKLTAPIEKTGDTLYFMEELTVESEDNIFVPVAWLNEIRRDAINMLQKAVAEQYRRSSKELDKDIKDLGSKNSIKVSDTNDERKVNNYEFDESNLISSSSLVEKENAIGINVSVQTQEQFELALLSSEITAIYADYETIERTRFYDMAKLTKASGKEFYLSLPQICRLSEYERLKKDLFEIIDKEELNGFIVKNFEEIALLRSLGIDEKQQKKIVLNFNMYTYNKEAKVFWNEMGITRFTAPVELNYQELRTLGITDCDMIVYGYLPLMVSAQCLFESTEGCRRCKTDGKNKNGNNHGDNHTGYLTDRLGKNFYVQTNCNGCYNIIYNGQALSLLKQETEIRGLKPRNIRLDFSLETVEEMKQILTAFVDTYRHGKKTGFELSDYTTGHFKRGVE
jgi:putative protease